MPSNPLFLGFVFVVLASGDNSTATPGSTALPQLPFTCVATTPNGIVAGGSEEDANSYGNRQVSVVGLWPDGTIVFEPGGSGFVTRDGALGMKFGWWRGIPGQLQIEGRRLDAPAPPLRAEVTKGYGALGFQATYVIFPTPGCWEVSGRVGDASVTFVTRVVKVGNGPAWHRDVP